MYYKGTSPAYTITSASSIPALCGTYLFKTGETSWLHCGSVISPFPTVTYSDGVTVTGMVKAKLYTCKGDSGGPVYDSHKAYGLTSGLSTEHGSCGSNASFTPISTATSELGVQLLLS